MFSIWPELFTFELLGIALLRISAGYLFMYSGIRLVRALWSTVETSRYHRLFNMSYAIALMSVGALLFFGLFTQPTALAGALLLLSPTSMRAGSSCVRHLTFLLLAICLSLITLGPGIPAIDLPI